MLGLHFCGGVAQKSHHLANHAELHEARAPGEEESAQDECTNEDVGPQEVVDVFQCEVEPAVGSENVVHS